MPLVLAVGQELDLPDDYKMDREWRRYWRASFRGGARYKTETDQDGDPLLIRHESETPEGYKRRRMVTTPRNYCAPILRRYNDFVFRREPTIPGEDIPWYADWLQDCDGYGTTAIDFFRSRLLAAQVDRESYLLCDRTGESNGRPMSRLEAMNQRVRPIIRPIDADTVLDAEWAGSALVYAALLMQDAEGDFISVYNTETFTDWRVKYDEVTRRWLVLEERPAVVHGYPMCPVIPLRPLFDDLGEGAGQSQCGPLADAQRCVYNMLSLVCEELYQNTYTQWVLRGVTANDVADGAAEMGAKRMLCVPNPQSGLDRIGSDVAQAASIRTSVADEEANIYRMAGISAADPTQAGAPESGIAKAFRFNDLAANLSALADAVEAAWNNAIWCLSEAFGVPHPGDIKMPDDFVPPDLGAELLEVVGAMSGRDTPPVIKQHLWRRFANRNLSLSDTEQDELEAQLPLVGQSLITPGNGFPLDGGSDADS